MKTTHIGSLPFKSIIEAIEFNKDLSLPALPTLPNLFEDEWMINQFSSGLMKPGHQLPFSCLQDFIKTYKGKIKLQVCGVQTLFSNINETLDQNNFLKWYKETIQRLINEIPNDFILFFDEPDLRVIDPKLWSVYSEFKSFEIGIHCCSKINWSKLNLENFNHISFDNSFIEKSELEFLEKTNKTLYYGVVDTKSAEINHLNLEDGFITPTCGLALTDWETTKKIQVILSNLS